jgi:hypothetical protein
LRVAAIAELTGDWGRGRRRRSVLDDDSGTGIRCWNRETLLPKQAGMLSHAPPGVVEAVFDRVAYPAEPFQVGRVEREKIRLLRGLDYERIG